MSDTLRDQIYTPDLQPGQILRCNADGTVSQIDEPPSLPPGVSFDPLTGALSIAEGSAVKQVVVPSGVKVNLAALPYGAAPEEYEAVPMDEESCRAAQKSFEKSIKDLKKKLPRLYKNFKP